MENTTIITDSPVGRCRINAADNSVSVGAIRINAHAVVGKVDVESSSLSDKTSSQYAFCHLAASLDESVIKKNKSVHLGRNDKPASSSRNIRLVKDSAHLDNILVDIGIIPVVAIEDASKAADLAHALVKGGLPASEVTFRTACAAEAIEAMIKAEPDMLVGAGTVLNVEQAERIWFYSDKPRSYASRP